jgi:4-amino-4-deoxy-L-arabinose transferase-like glycosyltransferase
MLTKGPQAPIYFVAGVGLFLLLMRRWRELFCWQHAAGIAVFLAIWLAWQIPFCLRVTPSQAWLMLTGDTTGRFEDTSLLKAGKHLIEFPLSVAACLLPWGVLLLAFFRREFRRGIDFGRSDVCFLAVSIGFAFFTCYVAPGARNRYFAPMLPLVALLIGLAGQQCSLAIAGSLGRLRRDYFIFAGVLCAGLGIWFTAATVLRLGAFRGQQPPTFALAFALTAVAATAIAFVTSRSTTGRDRLGVLALAAFLGLTYSGAIINVFVATWHPIGDEVAAATAEIPQGVELVSIGPVNRVFLYYYGRPIRLLPPDAGSGRGPREWTWFCMNGGADMPRFDAPYEKVGTISMESAYSDDPRHTVVVGRRLSDDTAKQSLGAADRRM